MLNPEPTASLKEAVRMARSRWPIEQQDRELKDDPGLDHFEGRTCTGCTHHTVPTSRFLASAASQLAATAGPS